MSFQSTVECALIENSKMEQLTSRNLRGIHFIVLFVVSCLGLASCTWPFIGTKPTNQGYDFQATPGFKPKLDSPKNAIELKYSPSKGRKEIVRTFSKTVTRTYSNGQLLHEKEESVDFTVKSDVLRVESSGDRAVIIETIRKDGLMDLYDLGFPELGESIEYTYTTRCEVKRAGNFPQNSIFFLPPVSLPKRPVEVGETWNYTADWISLRNGLPMSVELMTIFKNVFLCGAAGKCAEFEVSGEVKVPDAVTKKAEVQSLISGRILYNINSGSIIWSDVRNKERMQVGEDYMDVQTCTETILETPDTDRWVWRTRAQCDPMKELSAFVPGYAPTVQ